jgi:hypothetical protein
MVLPLTSNELLIVVSLFNFVNPERFNEQWIVVVLNCVNPETLSVDQIVVLFDIELYELISYTPELFIILFIIY